MKLSRKQAKQALETLPMHEILGKDVSRGLTHKQREFARNVALGETKASAYRKAYKSDPKHSTIVTAPYKLASDPRIKREIEAYELAIESAKYRSPIALRELVVQSLVQVLVDPESSQSAKISAARVLGTVTEVSAFTDRKEIKHISSSDDARKTIMDQLTALIKAEAIDVDPTQLLQELGQAHPSPTPLDAETDPDSPVHTIPLKSTSIPHESTLEDTPSPDKISPDDSDEVYSTSPQV